MTTLNLINGFSISSNIDQNTLLTVWALFVITFQSASSASVGQDDSIKKFPIVLPINLGQSVTINDVIYGENYNKNHAMAKPLAGNFLAKFDVY
ncbi:unnamed protein product, partial [Allacma fusca]